MILAFCSTVGGEALTTSNICTVSKWYDEWSDWNIPKHQPLAVFGAAKQLVTFVLYVPHAPPRNGLHIAVRHIDLDDPAWLTQPLFASEAPFLGFAEVFKEGDVGRGFALVETVIFNAFDEFGVVRLPAEEKSAVCCHETAPRELCALPGRADAVELGGARGHRRPFEIHGCDDSHHCEGV